MFDLLDELEDFIGLVIVFYLVVIAVALWIRFLIANEFYKVAVQKGHHERKYFWICFFLGLVGYLLVIALPFRQAVSDYSSQQPVSQGWGSAKLMREAGYQSFENTPSRSAGGPVSAGEWRCTCGRVHPAYVSTCSCGQNKSGR